MCRFIYIYIYIYIYVGNLGDIYIYRIYRGMYWGKNTQNARTHTYVASCVDEFAQKHTYVASFID